MKKLWLPILLFLIIPDLKGQTRQQAGTNLSPPMGWIGSKDDDELKLREMADAMVSSGMAKVGYRYLFLEDGWQGGRDKRNNIIADPHKFPSGIKALTDYVHSRGLKVGISTSPAQLSCNGTTGSLNFEDQDAQTFAQWGIDYLKYTYCGDETDSAKILGFYKKMGAAIGRTGSTIGFGYTQPWQTISLSGLPLAATSKTEGTLKRLINIYKTKEVSAGQSSFIELLDVKSVGYSSAGGIIWNDPPMLSVGLNLKGVASFTDTEYQSQMSLWSILASPLIVAADIRSMLPLTKRVLMNEELIAINQDLPFKNAVLKIEQDDWKVYVKPLSNGDYAVAILNRSDKLRNYSLSWSALGLTDQFVIRDIWQHQLIGKGRRWRGSVLGHETRVFRLKKV